MVRYEWARSKERANRAKHGVSFDLVEDFDWSRAIEIEDDRFDQGEVRMLALGPIKPSLFAVDLHAAKRGCERDQLAASNASGTERL